MPFTSRNNSGLTNGATAATIVAAPATNVQRMVRQVNVYNADTVAATITIRLNNNGAFRRIFVGSLAAGEMWSNKTGMNGDNKGAFDVLVLDATTKSLEIILSGAVTTNQLEWTTGYADDS